LEQLINLSLTVIVNKKQNIRFPAGSAEVVVTSDDDWLLSWWYVDVTYGALKKRCRHTTYITVYFMLIAEITLSMITHTYSTITVSYIVVSGSHK